MERMIYSDIGPRSLASLPNKPHRRYRQNEVGVSFRTRLLATFSVLIAMACFIIVISIIATKSRHRRLLKRAQGSTYMEIKKAVEKDEEVPLEHSQYVFEESTFTERNDLPQEKIYLCKNEEKHPYHIILFTSLPADGGQREFKIAENTIKTWSSLKPHVKPIIFISEATINNQFVSRIMNVACGSGFDVLFVENSLKGKYPILRNMFGRAYHRYPNATWYGYAGFRQIFDSSLRKGLHMLEHHPEILRKGNLVVGKSHSFEVGTESLSPDFPDLMDLGTMVQELYYFDATEDAVLSNDMNYYFTTRFGFPWEKIPALIVDSDFTDKFLMWYTMKNMSIAAVDATDAIFTLRQYYASEKNITRDHLKNYNDELLSGKWRFPQYYKKGLGTSKCLEYELTNKEMPYYVLIQKTRKYIRRVTKSRPINISYYCRIVHENNVIFIDGHGSVAGYGDINCNIVQQVVDIKRMDERKGNLLN